jgi:regulator of replication initiation timing
MSELVLDIVTSYENRISMVEELVSGKYYATAAFEASLAAVVDERAMLKASLQEMLSKNCSLRKKDFGSLTESTISDAGIKKRELEEEHKRVAEELKEFLDDQKQLIISLRQQLVDFSCKKIDKDALETTMATIKAEYQHRSERVFAMLRDFQIRLESFQREQGELNCKLKSLVEKGESLRLEDLRQLESIKAQEGRKANRELRRADVDRLLAHFNQQRKESSSQGRQ